MATLAFANSAVQVLPGTYEWQCACSDILSSFGCYKLQAALEAAWQLPTSLRLHLNLAGCQCLLLDATASHCRQQLRTVTAFLCMVQQSDRCSGNYTLDMLEYGAGLALERNYCCGGLSSQAVSTVQVRHSSISCPTTILTQDDRNCAVPCLHIAAINLHDRPYVWMLVTV